MYHGINLLHGVDLANLTPRQVAQAAFDNYSKLVVATLYHRNNHAPSLLGKAQILSRRGFENIVVSEDKTLSALVIILQASLFCVCQVEQKCFCTNTVCSSDCRTLQAYFAPSSKELKDRLLIFVFGTNELNVIQNREKIKQKIL